MAAPSRRPRVALAARLAAEPHRFDFFKAVWLLERLAPERARPGEGADARAEAAKLASEISLGFPPSALAALVPAERPGGRPTLRVRLLGLAGHAGPLPDSLAETLVRRQSARDYATRDFLDIFNHRILSHYYRAHAHASPAFPRGAIGRSAFARAALSLIGLGSPALDRRQKLDDVGLAAAAGLLAGERRGFTGLETLLRDQLGLPIRLEPFVGRWIRLEPEDRARLTARRGPWPALGRGAALGARAWDVSSRFAVAAGPLSRAEFDSLLPGGARLGPLRALVRFYAGDQFECQLRLRLRRVETPATVLSAKAGGRLGWTAWLRVKTETAATGDVVVSPRSFGEA